MKLQSAQLRVVLAAGGNPTGIVCFPDSSHRGDYTAIAKDFMAADSSIEQFGFLEGGDQFHFQMSGGEFCGNAARAAALLISEETGRKEGEFTMSGFGGNVQYRILGSEVECRFPGLQMRRREVSVHGVQAELVDMGGIVHVVLPLDFPFSSDPDTYKSEHREIVTVLKLETKPAVGVIWRKKAADGSIAIHPVVWVRDIDSFFYETACGSGTLAALEVGGSDSAYVLQPSGQSIHAEKQPDAYVLRSRMQVQDAI